MLIIPLTLLVIFMILYSMFGSMKWASLILVTVAMAPIGGIAGAVSDGDQLQRLLRHRIPGAVRSLGADRRDHAGVHQSIARARPFDPGRRRSKARSCGSGRF